ncbi:hypothetical protein [uncultured Oscillibacter sp.]|uniref:hypothetical protein n=1 Tax=uncultured Oscillibacter sp. TaxID=876091 RepID=UPI0025DBF03E|nr:hypothetical protein [uncultured Oscillibacter sp.]
MRLLISAIVYPSILLYLIFISDKNSGLHPKYIQVSDNELFAYSLFLWLVFIVLAINSFNSSGGLSISPKSEEIFNLVAGVCVLLSEPAFLFINARLKKKHPSPLQIPYKAVQRYFSKEVSQEEIETTIQQALKLYFDLF